MQKTILRPGQALVTIDFGKDGKMTRRMTVTNISQTRDVFRTEGLLTASDSVDVTFRAHYDVNDQDGIEDLGTPDSNV